MKTLLKPALMSVFCLAALTPLQAQNINKNAATNVQAARQMLSFNDDWRFRLGDIDYANPMTPLDNWTWKAATPTDSANPANAVKTLNATGWKATRNGEDIFGQKPGYAWLHATLPQRAGDTVLNFSSIDDNATVFVNGKEVAKHSGWNSPFKTNVTNALNATGANEVYILVENQGGGGGLGGAVMVAENSKKASGPALPGYNETGWRQLSVPHDWMIEGRAGNDPSVMVGPFDPKSPGTHESGYLNGGAGWYRKTFTPAANMQGKRAYLQFDGVYMDSDVWINGQHIGGQPYGYTTFGFDISPYLKYGQPNVVAVRANVTQPASRFYSVFGCGNLSQRLADLYQSGSHSAQRRRFRHHAANYRCERANARAFDDSKWRQNGGKRDFDHDDCRAGRQTCGDRKDHEIAGRWRQRRIRSDDERGESQALGHSHAQPLPRHDRSSHR